MTPISTSRAARVRTGQLVSTDEELAQSISAGRWWNRQRDLVDIVGWEDFAFASERVVPALRSRVAVFPAHRRSRTFPLPKVNGGHRKLLAANPFDEAIYRQVVGEIAADIDFHLGPEVTSYRLRSLHPTWQFRSRKYGMATGREVARGHTYAKDFAGVAKLDVQTYYPSVTPTTLRHVLCSELQCPEDSVERVMAVIEDWQTCWGVRGIPVGPEASGLLGNAVLAPLDAALRAEGLAFTRYTDDVTIFLRTRDDWNAIKSLVTSVLASLGLQLNESKTRFITDPIEGRYSAGWDPALDRLTVMLREAPGKGLERARWLFEREMDREDPSWRQIRYTLKVLANRSDPHALHAVRHESRLWLGSPGECGLYLSRLHARGLCDPEWLAAEATSAWDHGTAIARYHQLLALRWGKSKLPADVTEHLHQLVVSHSAEMPIRVAAADTCSNGTGWTPGEAISLVHEVGDAQLQRALVLSLRHGSTPSTKHLRTLRGVESVLSSLAWVEAGVPGAPRF